MNGFCTGTSGGGGGGSGGGGGAATGGGSSTGGGGGGSGRLTLRQYQLRVEGTSIAVPACYRESVLPSMPATVPSRMLEALFWETPSGEQFLALSELGPYTLAQAPTITPPEGVRARSPGFFVFERSVTSRYPGREATEVRGTSLEVTLDDTTTTSLTGRLKLTARYLCIAGRDACPAPNPTLDSGSCTVTLPLSGREVPVTTKWTTPEGAALSGATRYLTAMTTLQQPANVSCYRDHALPSGPAVDEAGAVRLDVWQHTSSRVTTAPMTFQLGDTATLSLSDFGWDGSSYLALGSTMSPIPGVQATELRDTRATFTFTPGDEVRSQLQLSAQSSCMPGAQPCPVTAVPLSCAQSAAFTAVRLP